MSLDMRVYRLSILDDNDIQYISKKDIEDLKKRDFEFQEGSIVCYEENY